MANKFAEAGSKLAKTVWSGISFANDLFEDVKDFWQEVWVKAFMWVGKWAANAIDFAWDVWAWLIDVWSGIASEVSWKDLNTDLSSKEWILDKANKHLQKWFKQIDESMKSDIGDTVIWKWIVDLAWIGWELAAPIWAYKWAKIAKEYIQTVKNTPKVLSKLKELVIKAKDEWREVAQSEIDDILTKAWITWKNIAKDAAKVTKELDPKTASFLQKLSSYSPEEVATNWPKLSKLMTAWKLWVAWVFNEMTDKDMEEVTQAVAEYSQPTEKVEDGITLPAPEQKESSPIWTEIKQDPDNIVDKKKELEILKEKNAWSLNMSTSVVDLMKGLGVDSKQEARKLIFEKMTGKPYTASAEDNNQLKALIEEAFSKGTLPDYFPSLKR